MSFLQSRLSSKRRSVSVAGVAFAVAVGGLVIAGPASAAEIYDVTTKPSGSYLSAAGSMDLATHGEHISTCDNSTDGAGVIGYWKVGSGGTVHSLYNGKGRATCEDVNASASESSRIYLKVCLRNNGTVVTATCSAWESFPAGA
ncbi:hypothetical protein ACIQM3_02045 [Streptomyces sp. NPDC091271]|uniref:hypothetical protein n=1 Tax=Streptomyces sp. NPDC091271 TaxID=3365980 RepID=UPI0037FC0ACE